MLTYERSDSLKIVVYSDYAGCLNIVKSTSGYVFKLAGEAISWSISKQVVIASTMMYAKFIACYETTEYAL
jgi:hypothetical protein